LNLEDSLYKAQLLVVGSAQFAETPQVGDFDGVAFLGGDYKAAREKWLKKLN
jgi:hypothetical protein